MREELAELVNHEPQASGLQILLVFYQHPEWFIMPPCTETCQSGVG